MANDTSTRAGGASSARRPKRAERQPPGRKTAKATVDARTEAQRIRREAETDAARVRAEAEEHARRLVLDARASADGVRAEGMELVSKLRQVSDALLAHADLLSQDVEKLHSRMVGELEGVLPEGAGPSESEDESVLEVPEFVSRDQR